MFIALGKNDLNAMSLVNQIMKIKKIEKENSLYSEKKRARYNKKWSKNRPKTCCLVFLSNTSNYRNKKLFNKKNGREEKFNIYLLPFVFLCCIDKL